MLSRIKKIIKNFIGFKNRDIEIIKSQLRELEWASIYHDSIRDIKPIQNLSLNIGRWAGNYTFFYLLKRVLFEIKPYSILEIGLGESSKFVSTFIEMENTVNAHDIVEHDQNWIDNFNSKFQLSKFSKIIKCDLTETKIKGFKVIGYSDFINNVNKNYSLYIVDGPFGSDRFSRRDVLELFKEIEIDHEFVVIFDDTDRIGERDTVFDICDILENKGINYFTNTYHGKKSVTIIATLKYKFCTSF